MTIHLNYHDTMRVRDLLGVRLQIRDSERIVMRKCNEGVGLAFGLILMLGAVGCDTSTEDETEKPKAEEPSPYNMESRKADVGVGKKGAKLRADQSTATKVLGGAAIQAMFETKEKAVFQIQIPQALALYKAQDSFGKGPQSHEEFMQKIIRANNIQLPELPEGMHYNYVPDGGEKGDGELRVEPDVPAGGNATEATPPAEAQPNP